MRPVLSLLLVLACSAPAAAGESDGAPHESADASVVLDVAKDLFPNGAPNLLSPESLANAKYRLPKGAAPKDTRALPTHFDYRVGPVQFDLDGRVSAKAPAARSVVPEVPDPSRLGGAAGGSGEVKGEVRYRGTQWELYGARRLGVDQNDGAPPAAADSTTVGANYRLPEWMSGGKLGAQLEVAPSDARTARIEYRRSLGPAEGYIAAESSFDPDLPLLQRRPDRFRGGVGAKF